MDSLILPDIADGEDKSSPFANCIRKNYKHLRKWAKRTKTDCFRIYDRQIREFPLAIDLYGGRFCIHYFAKKGEEPDPPKEFVEQVENNLKKIFGPDQVVYWRIRKQTKETRQYEKASDSKEFFSVYEYGVKFKVNLTDYLDTGLFLDHRETRQIVAGLAKDKTLLNLFAYTCSFSVHAAYAGAKFTKSVDMSNTYTSWGSDNFKLNSLSQNNEVVREDCLKFLPEEIQRGKKYDLIIIDPPTISRSKKMDGLFDIQEDYSFLLNQSLKLLTNEGIIFFSTNSRKFKFDETLFPTCKVEEISHKTIPIDFSDPKIHRCWKLTLKH